ncbi:MAG: hypothetical protein FJ179_03135 [Gammaproteobacteria bacterium]|nr:hypothetical protein [Gammaproteobacteria bacterium]
MKSTYRVLVAMVMLGGNCLAAGCGREQAPAQTSTPSKTDKPTLPFGERRIELLITCYKAIMLTQEKYGSRAAHTESSGLAASLEPWRRMIEQRLVGDLTDGAEKMRINERIEASIDALVKAQPYASTEVLLNTARRCADLETQNAWGAFPR